MTLVPCVMTSQKSLRKELLFVMFRRIHGGISCIHTIWGQRTVYYNCYSALQNVFYIYIKVNYVAEMKNWCSGMLSGVHWCLAEEMCLVCQLVGGPSHVGGTLFKPIQQIFVESLDGMKCWWRGKAAQIMAWVLEGFPIAIALNI